MEKKQARLAAIYTRLGEIESWSAEGRAATILSGLQVDNCVCVCGGGGGGNLICWCWKK